MFTIVVKSDNPEPAPSPASDRLPTGFLKSRVYAKLLMRLISECYQTFNRQMEEVVPYVA